MILHLSAMGPLRHMSVPRLFPLPTLEILSPDVFTPVSTCLPVSLLVALVSTCLPLVSAYMAGCFYTCLHLSLGLSPCLYALGRLILHLSPYLSPFLLHLSPLVWAYSGHAWPDDFVSHLSLWWSFCFCLSPCYTCLHLSPCLSPLLLHWSPFLSPCLSNLTT